MEKFTVRDRVLIFTEKTNQTKKVMAKKIGISPTNLAPSATNSRFSSETIAKFLQVYPEVSAEWLMRGEGPMLRQKTDGVINGDVTNHAENNSTASIVFNFEKQTADIMKAKDDLIENLQRHVASLQHTIELMQRNIKD